MGDLGVAASRRDTFCLAPRPGFFATSRVNKESHIQNGLSEPAYQLFGIPELHAVHPDGRLQSHTGGARGTPQPWNSA